VKVFRNTLYILIALCAFGALVLFLLSHKPAPQTITYGMSFNTPYARELGLDWRQTYDAILDDLEVRHLRLAAHWPMVEPVPGQYNFNELDYQMRRAEEVGASVILGVGRRLPRWPECHIPSWSMALEKESRDEALLAYISAVVERYKDSPALKWWQVENEPFLTVFAYEHCGTLDVELLERELSLVRELDPERPILVTDSGNLGTWFGAYSRADVFGTSVYVHLWNPEIGPLRTILPAWFYRVKDNLMAIVYGEKPSVLIELSVEPWLLEPIVEAPLEVQFSRMDLQKFEEILEYAERTHYEEQYLWGAEWWYWLHLQGRSEMWERGQRLYSKDVIN
jgi:hypothetical protein